jgi:hypothetical protein
MSQSINGKYSTAQVMMSLSAIAYTSFDSLDRLQGNLNEAVALGQEYEAIWWSRDRDNLLYVVRNRVTEEYAIAIKGPVFRFGLSFLFDLYEDLGIPHQVYLPFGRLGNAKIAAGLLETIQNINNFYFNGRTLTQIVSHFPKGSKVYITGHSLGGTLAMGYAAKLVCNDLMDLDIIPYTFGSPGAGNKAFTDLFNHNSNHCLFPHSFNCVNSRDIIPYAWHDLQGIPAIDYEDIKCPINFVLCLDCIARLLILARTVYTAPSLNLLLPGYIEPNISYFQEAMLQHQHNTYLELLGLYPVNAIPYSFKQQREEMVSESL